MLRVELSRHGILWRCTDLGARFGSRSGRALPRIPRDTGGRRSFRRLLSLVSRTPDASVRVTVSRSRDGWLDATAVAAVAAGMLARATLSATGGYLPFSYAPFVLALLAMSNSVVPADIPANSLKPADITADTLNSATGKLLKFWIGRANDALGKNSAGRLVKSGKVEELRERLAEHYGVDRKAPKQEPVAGAATVDDSIRSRQWDDFRLLGEEWSQTVKAGGQFVLDKDSAGAIPQAMQQEIEHLMNRIHISPTLSNAPVTDMSNEAVALLIRAAQDGSLSAQSQLQQIQRTFMHPVQQLPTPESTAAASTAAATSIPAAILSAPAPAPVNLVPVPSWQFYYPPAIMQTSLPLPNSNSGTTLAPSTSQALSGDAALLSNIQEEIKSLQQVNGIREAIQQFKSGRVADFRKRYGPGVVDGKKQKSHELWESMKMVVSRRERLSTQLEEHFGGDEEKFYAFFTIPDSELAQRSRPSKKPVERLRALNRLVAAISPMQRDLAEECQQLKYHTADGQFSQLLWQAAWNGMNDWEIWRALGKEQYLN
ncbi:hypothetical protein HWV62_36450 [Athelia sp. TMB]|nr:hypothetical protein HWV62_36450 [Athelia sp. TMB]